MSNARYNLMHRNASFKWITDDFLFLGWLRMTPPIVKEEIAATKHRLEILDDEFVYRFLQDLPEKVAEKFNKDDYYEEKNWSTKNIKSELNLHKKIISCSRKMSEHASVNGKFYFNNFR